MITTAQIQSAIALLNGQDIQPTAGGVQFKDAAPFLAGVVDNGVSPDDPRVIKRTNEATKIVLDNLIPVGGMMTVNTVASGTLLVLPPSMENCIEAVPVDPNTAVYGDTDITQGWYEIVNNSTYLDPFQHHDNPVVDHGLWPKGSSGANANILVRVYEFPGLTPVTATVAVTGAKRYVPLKGDADFLIVQNLEALKLIILSIERNENSQPDEAQKYMQQGLEMLQAEVKKHLLDPRNYMRRKSQYQNESMLMPENTMGWVRANIALDLEAALKTGRRDLIWSINQIERRIMQNGKIYKDMIRHIDTTVVGGIVYFPVNVEAVLAVDLNGCPIPIRSQFFQYLDNGPGKFPVHNMLIDHGNEMLAGTQTIRRKYRLVADCTTSQTLSAICLLKWVAKEPTDYMTIKNYEALRLMMTAKFLEEKEDWQNAQANEAKAFEVLETELKNYLSGIRVTPHIQTYGFGLGNVGNYWTM